MTIKTLILLFALNGLMLGQNITNIKITQTTNNFKTVKDSVMKLIDSTNYITIKTCEGFREFYLTKDSLNWTGFFIKNLIVETEPQSIIEIINGVEYYYKPMITTLIKFNADSLYSELIKLKVKQVIQLKHDDIRNKMNQYYRKKGIKTEFPLYGCSHDCDMIININSKSVSYAHCSIVERKELFIIPTIQIFYKIDNLLIKTFNNYYN